MYESIMKKPIKNVQTKEGLKNSSVYINKRLFVCLFLLLATHELLEGCREDSRCPREPSKLAMVTLQRLRGSEREQHG
jgi:hypothetical protein